ncbi:epidermal growth factor-like protein 6 [Neocloeon triangulifer]|uniref:epidermal growth factor-like protein 6 n=1 Tax=Neocloeon triangulifer TaxID=2078957 RepID=UPI00286EC4A0|nr:epidermal growth factor-like protein 6 [Neocloeon triangulifer]
MHRREGCLFFLLLAAAVNFNDAFSLARDKRQLHTLPESETFPWLCEKKCQNNGACVGPNKCVCLDDQYGGDQCQIPINDCEQNPTPKNAKILVCLIRHCEFECDPGYAFSEGRNFSNFYCEQNKWIDNFTDEEWTYFPNCERLENEEEAATTPKPARAVSTRKCG